MPSISSASSQQSGINRGKKDCAVWDVCLQSCCCKHGHVAHVPASPVDTGDGVWLRGWGTALAPGPASQGRMHTAWSWSRGRESEQSG